MKRVLPLVFGLCVALTVQGREIISLTEGWTVRSAYDVSEKPAKQAVSIPHTWNAEDVFQGMKYEHAAYVYECCLPVNRDDAKRVFLRFGAAASVADVMVNGQYVGAHYGGYTAFCFEITDFLQADGNLLTVVCSNAFRTDVAPLTGDFNVSGGITRPVWLIVTGRDCISPLDNASSGVYVHQDSVSADSASVSVETVLSATCAAEVRTGIFDAEGQLVGSVQTPAHGERIVQPVTIEHPHLWNGRKQPYLYRVKVELLKDGAVVDCVEERLGLRSFRVDPEQGFFLNGEQLDLHGVCCYDEAPGKGCVYDEAAMCQDARLIAQMGATAVRFVSYPHSEYDAWQYDSLGIVVWSELNFAGSRDSYWTGYVRNPQFEAHLMLNLEEMICQNYNSPSICFWSLCCELPFRHDALAAFLKQLNDRAKQLDPQRLTTMAVCQDQNRFQHITDVIGFSDWAGARKQGFSQFVDEAHALAGEQPVGLCGYGAAGSIHQHGLPKKQSGAVPTEEFQARAHEEEWEQLATRPYIWCKFVCQFADNLSAPQHEDNKRGVAEMGLVTCDRSVCKDAYYFYQANWTTAPMLHIAARRYSERTDSVADIKVYTNQPKATLYVNGVRIGVLKNDGKGRIIYPRIPLRRGENTIEVNAGKELTDCCTWMVK